MMARTSVISAVLDFAGIHGFSAHACPDAVNDYPMALLTSAAGDVGCPGHRSPSHALKLMTTPHAQHMPSSVSPMATSSRCRPFCGSGIGSGITIRSTPLRALGSILCRRRRVCIPLWRRDSRCAGIRRCVVQSSRQHESDRCILGTRQANSLGTREAGWCS